MPKVNYTQRSFNAGELTPKLLARTDFDKYASGCSVMENLIPTVQGTAVKRAGTVFAAEVKSSNLDTVLHGFSDTTGNNYIIEIGHQYMRFFKEDGAVVGGPYELATPFIDNYLHTLQFAQSGDVLYIASNYYAPRKLIKNSSSDTDWTLQTITFDWPPFQDTNTDTTAEMYVSDVEGTGITVTAVGHSPFTPAMASAGVYIKFDDPEVRGISEWKTGTDYVIGDRRYYEQNTYRATSNGQSGAIEPTHTTRDYEVSDGAVDWVFLHSGSGYVKITGYTSPTQVTADVISPVPNGVRTASYATWRWSWGSWADTTLEGFPSSVTIHENRLVFGGSNLQPQTIWGSESGNYENFEVGTNDDDSYQYTLGSDQLNKILWLNSGRVLLIGTDYGEFSMSGTRIYESITPTNVRVARQTNTGSTVHRPIRISEKVFFTEKNNLKLNKLTYNYDTDSYITTDVSVLSEHITSPSIAQGALQDSPQTIAWFPRYYAPTLAGDGCIVALTHNENESVIAWHKHDVGGFVESIAVIKKDTYDQIWMVVKRTINGATVRYVEYMDPPGKTDNYLDCALVYNGASTTTITGLSHLEGATVSILADGATQTNKTVSSGQITLDSAASVVYVGYAYQANLQTMPIVPQPDQGTGLNSRVTTVTLRVLDTGEGISVGPDSLNLKEVSIRKPGDLMDAPVPAYSGILGPIDWHWEFERDSRVHVQHNLPLPFELCSITADIMVYEE